MNLDWLKKIPFEKVSEYFGSIRGPNVSRTWQVALVSVSGFILAGTAGVFYLKWREEISEDANDFVLLENVAEDLWTAKYYFQMKFPPLAVSSNMCVIRLQSGLLVYNPVRLTPQLKKQIDAIGIDVKFVVVPNKEHTSFFADYVESYPNIKLFCTSGALNIVNKRLKSRGISSPLNGIFELKDNVLPEGVWTRDELEHRHFLEKEWLDEIVLFHKPSKVLVTADTCFNIKKGDIKLKRSYMVPIMEGFASKFGVDRIGVSSNFGYLIKDKKKAMEDLDRICRWDFKGIIMAHGTVVPPQGNDNVKTQWKAEWERLLV